MAHALDIVREYFPQVKTVKDAEENVKIEVTSKDEQSAVVRDHKGCAMAVACKRKLKLDGVIISVSTAYLVKDNVATRYKLPESVSREVVSFDRKGGFRPGHYELAYPKKTQKLGAMSHQNKVSGPHNGKKEAVAHHFTEGIRTVLGSTKKGIS